MSKFNIGDTIWTPLPAQRQIDVLCPVCFGQRKVTVILGDDTHIETPCEFCCLGSDDPQGTVTEWTSSAGAMARIVTEVRETVTRTTHTVEYVCDTWVVTAERAFTTQEEAIAVAIAESEAQALDEAERSATRKKHSHKSYAWHVGYHKREAKRAREQAAFHEQRAVECAARVRKKATNPASAG
jgi:hypothetical protein